VDIRYQASSQRWWSWHDGHTARADNINGSNEIIPIKMVVCTTCDGRGNYVNPNIDSHGLSQDDFDQDPEFFEHYHSGTYDIRCEHCQGQNVIPWPISRKHIRWAKEWLKGMDEWMAESQAERDVGA